MVILHSYTLITMSILFFIRGAVALRCLPGMREVLGLNPLGDNILCSPSLLEETINRGPNTPIPMTHALICEELKDPGIPPKVVP